MKKVFAVLIFLFLASSCSKFPVSESKNIIIHKNENIISSIPGDFDGDTYPEYIYIASSNDGNSYIKLIDGYKTFYKELNFKLDNYSSNVQDVNGDGKEDLILYSIEDNTQNVYVFSYNKDLYSTFAPDVISRFVGFIKSSDGYKITCGSHEKLIKSKDKMDLKLFYTDLDYREDGPVFNTEGTVTTRDGRIIYTVSIVFNVDTKGQINPLDLKVTPYIESEEE